jgi:hypothetical protein
MWSLLNGLGLNGSWLPLLVSLVLIPSLYILLAIDVHKEYGEAVREVARAQTIRPLQRSLALRVELTQDLRVFELEWWLVGAFGALIVAIMASGYLVDWSDAKNVSHQVVETSYSCHTTAGKNLLCTVEPVKVSAPIQVAMSLYATLVGVAVGFRFGWARVRFAQDLTKYYMAYMLGENVYDTPQNAAHIGEAVMPPSGYSIGQSKYIGEFLRSCARALADESHLAKSSLATTLNEEIASIEQYIGDTPNTVSQQMVLRLTGEFYRRVHNCNPTTDETFWTAVQVAADQIVAEIGAIKIPPPPE